MTSRTLFSVGGLLTLGAVALASPTFPNRGSAASSGQIPGETAAAFGRYAAVASDATLAELYDPDVFLNVRSLEPRERTVALAQVRAGGTSIRRLRRGQPTGGDIDIPKAWLHHWIGTAFVPSATLDEVLAVAQDYDDHARIFAPDVVHSSILRRHSDTEMLVRLRVRAKRIITVTYETHHEVRYERLTPKRAFSTAHATWVREILDANKPGEREKPEGEGYLWRVRGTWRYEEVDDGVLMENESLMLTRQVPWLLRPIVGPLVRNGPRDGVQKALQAVRREV